MLATELEMNVSIDETLKDSIVKGNPEWQVGVKEFVMEKPSLFKPILEYYKQTSNAIVLDSEIVCLEGSILEQGTVSIDLEFSEYRYDGFATHFFKQKLRKKLHARLDSESCQLCFKVLQFQDPIHDC